MVEKISVQIGLEGAAEVEKQLADIGKAGNEAFADLGKAGTDAADGIAKAGESSATTATEIGKIDTAAQRATESVKGLSLETVKTGLEIAKLSAEIARVGVEIGLTIQRHRGWVSQLIHLGSSASTAVRAVALLSPEITAVGAALVPVAAAVAGAAIGFEALEKAALKAASGLEQLNHSLQMLATESGQGFDSLQQGKALFEQLGLSAATFEGTVRKVGETLGGLNLGDALKKSTDDASDALLKLRAAQDALFKSNTTDEVIAAQKGLADAYTKTAEVAANEIGKILGQVKALEAGQKDITFDPLVKSETIIKAVGLSMKEVTDNGGDAAQALLKFIANADKLTAVKVGAAFGFKDEDVDRIRRAGGEIAAIADRVKGIGPLLSPQDVAAMERLRTKTQEVDRAWVRLKASVSTSFFATEAAKFAGDLETIKAGVLNFAAASIEAFGRAGAGLMQGFGAGLATTWQELTAIGSVLAAFGNAAILAFTNPLQAVQLLGSAIADFASAIGGVAWDAISGAGVAAWNAVVTAVQAAGSAIADFVSSLPSITWDAISKAGVAAWNAIVAAIQGAGTAVADFASKITSIVWDAISGAGVAAWNALTGAINDAIAAVGNYITKLLQALGLKPSAPAGGGGGAPGLARGGLLGGRGTGTSDSNLAWLSRGEYIMPARAVSQPGVLEFLEALRRSGRIPGFADGGMFIRGQGFAGSGGVSEKIIGWIAQIAAANNQTHIALDNAARSLAEALDSVGKSLTDALFNVVQNMQQTANEFNRRGMARGGLLGGRGSGTSDSNLAWVSRGEHIMPARAVAQPGVLEFLEALRRSGGNLRAVIDGMGRFALGGMVPRAMPAFASGGLAGGMSNVTIQFPGLPAISGLRASSDVVDQLHKAAALAQVRSGGRKPSRYS